MAPAGNSVIPVPPALRLFRNAVFHFQLTDRKHVQFFDLEKFNWAVTLHLALRAFFAAKDR